MPEISSVALFGASGNSGDVIIPMLLSAGLDVTVVGRGGSNKSFPFGTKVVTADYTSVASLTLVLQNIDAVISLVGPQGLQYQNRMIDAAVAAGAKYFIPSEFGHNHPDPRVFPLVPLFETKRNAIEYLKTKEKDGLSWTVIITGLWFDWGLQFSMFDIDMTTHKAVLWDGGNTTFRTINIQDLAVAISTLLTDPSARAAAQNTHVYISSFETTQKEVLAAAEEVTGKKFKIDHVDSETVFKENEAMAAKLDLGAIKTLLTAITVSNRGLSDFGKKVDEWNKLLLGASRKESVIETLRRAAEGGAPKGKLPTEV